MKKINIFYQSYYKYFYISKFLLTKQKNIFNVNFIRYRADINKVSLLSIFWIFFLLFSQIPQLKKYNKSQLLEKIGHSCLIVTKAKSELYINLKKITNFFLLFAGTDLVTVQKKQKNSINNLILKKNNYYSELFFFPPRVVQVNPFNIIMTVVYNNFMSVYEKAQFFRICQIPVTGHWNTKKLKKK